MRRVIDADEIKRLRAFEGRLKLAALTRKQWERFDTCCHGGIVRQRIPLMEWLEIANHQTGAMSR